MTASAAGSPIGAAGSKGTAGAAACLPVFAGALLILAACGGPTVVERENEVPLAPGTEVQITSHELGQHTPAVDGNRVVWIDPRLERLGGSDVFTRTVDGPVRRVSSDDAEPESFLGVSGDRIVWSDRRTADETASDNTDIFLVDLAATDGGERQLTADPAPQRDPDVSGRWVAWTDLRDGNQDVFAFDLETDEMIRITDEEPNQFGPALSGELLVWLDGRDGGSIRLRDLVTGEERRLVAGVDAVGAVDVGGGRVVWAEEGGEGAEIRLLEIGTGEVQTLASGPVRRFNPVVSGSLVVWEEQPDAATRLLLAFDLSSERLMRIPDARIETDMFRPDVSGRRVVRQDLRDNNFDIFLFEVAP